MKIQIPDPIKDRFQKFTDFTEAELTTAMKNRDAMETIEYIGRAIAILTKKEKLFTWLIEAHTSEDVWTVVAGFKVTPEMAPNADPFSPVQFLKLFAENNGCDVKAGDKIKKIFIQENVLASTSSPRIEIADIKESGTHSKSFWYWLTRTSRQQVQIEIALAYAIKLKARE